MLEHRTASPLVAFLYQLMRDHVPYGVVEKIVVEDERAREENSVEGEDFEYILSNGHLGKYAEDVAKRLLKGS